ncbi:universal stress protein [Halopiger xanaduensis]|uniref:UspA domain-containing protein n=1 Tax=Halopiger xanaduensis (strain DSM 18323 / JCM 14033 / SH-6) TaxID=797210 RepID=F8DDN4_HALXS|nr:universal stress protein [Halopiger xanaduensis]AEH39136.1 UspA domain-containing protein [Halopiger xanaduensis SH-6]
MYTDILVPTDGSESSAAAVEHGIEIASPHAATVHFLHAVDVGTEMSASGLGNIAPDLTETLESEAEDALDDAVARAEESDVAYERTVLEGVPHEVIAEYSTENEIDLIVMGASGRSGLADHLLGSSTDRVVRSVETSVLIARPS